MVTCKEVWPGLRVAANLGALGLCSQQNARGRSPRGWHPGGIHPEPRVEQFELGLRPDADDVDVDRSIGGTRERETHDRHLAAGVDVQGAEARAGLRGIDDYRQIRGAVTRRNRQASRDRRNRSAERHRRGRLAGHKGGVVGITSRVAALLKADPVRGDGGVCLLDSSPERAVHVGRRVRIADAVDCDVRAARVRVDREAGGERTRRHHQQGNGDNRRHTEPEHA